MNIEASMRIVIVGLGSMGKRRIRLIEELYSSYEIVGVDGREDRRAEATQKFGISCFSSLEEVGGGIDCVFVCTSPLSHNSIIHSALTLGANVFTELNLVADGYKENIELAKKKGLTLFLSSTFFYSEEIRYIRKQVDGLHKMNYVYHIGQYLPDWHPWENYKDFFLGDKRTNGCREIMAIELPWLVGTFGDVIDVNVLSDKQTALNIEYYDNYLIEIQHENGNKGCLIVDVVCPYAVRNLEVYAEDVYLSWAGTPDSLKKYDRYDKELKQVKLQENAEHMSGYQAFVIENAYKNEIQDFFDVVEGKKEPLYNFEKDMQVLKLIDKIGA